MAKKVSLGGLGKKMAKAWSKHKDDETSYGIINMPPGINNGVAQFSDYSFGKYKNGNNKGVDFCRLSGVATEDFSNDHDVPTKGLQTGIMLPLGTTKTSKGERSAEENIAAFANEIRKLGIETSEYDIFEDDSLLEMMETLKEEAPVFRFTTTKEDDQGRYFENWRGTKGLEEYSVEDDEEVEEEEEEDEESTEDEEDSEEDGETEEDAEGDEESEDEEESDSDVDLEELAALADDEDEEAAETLTALADKAGVDPNHYATWKEVVAVLTEEEEEGDEEEEEEYTPEKEDVVMYKPPRAKKATECTVLRVIKSKKTVDLEDIENEGKTYKGIPWIKVKPVE